MTIGEHVRAKNLRDNLDSAACQTEPDTSEVSCGLHAMAARALVAGDIEGFFGYADSEHQWHLFWDNRGYFWRHGLYEEALLCCVTSSKYGASGLPIALMRTLFDVADRARLRALGLPLPHPGPYTLWRGCQPRWRRGYSWTFTQAIAVEFVERIPDAALYTLTIPNDRSIYTYLGNSHRDEDEVLVSVRPHWKPLRLA